MIYLVFEFVCLFVSSSRPNLVVKLIWRVCCFYFSIWKNIWRENFPKAFVLHANIFPHNVYHLISSNSFFIILHNSSLLFAIFIEYLTQKALREISRIFIPCSRCRKAEKVNKTFFFFFFEKLEFVA